MSSTTRTLLEIRNHIKDVTRVTQKNDMIDAMVNLTLMEINDPGWATKGYSHNWSFNRRKDSFSTVASTEFYVMPRDVDKIALVRQIESPVKLKYIRDDTFYRRIANPEAEGNPLYYRLWEEEGVSTRLSTDDTITIVSSSTSDGSTISVSIAGYDNNKIRRSESLNLNGTTEVGGTITFDASRPIRISKSTDTTGTITIKETTSGTTLLTLGEHERSPRFKVIGLYPIPSSAITIYLEYYTRIRRLEHDSAVPDIDSKWTWLIIQGTLSKVYRYQNKESDSMTSLNIFKQGLKAMVESDLSYPDEIPSLKGRGSNLAGVLELSDEQYSIFIPNG